MRENQRAGIAIHIWSVSFSEYDSVDTHFRQPQLVALVLVLLLLLQYHIKVHARRDKLGCYRHGRLQVHGRVRPKVWNKENIS
jgi:hypothetical protein